MTKKKSILLQVLLLLGLCGIVIGVLMLTGCSNDGSNELGESTALEAVHFNGDDYFVTSAMGRMTNQEAFELMLDSEEAIFVFLDLVDEVLLRGNYEIDADSLVTFLEEFKADIPDFEAWMLQEGFASEEEVMRVLELDELRQAAVRHLVEVTDEEIEEAFAMFFDPEVDDLDEVRDDIYDHLVEQEIRMISTEEIARLRYEAGFEIFNETLEAAYEQYLTHFMFEIDLQAASSQDESEVIARINGVDITSGQVFEALSGQFGLALAFGQLDEMIVATHFPIDPAEVNEIIDELRVEFGDEFHSILAGAGFETEEDLFDYFESMLIEEAMIRAHFPPTEERLRELHAEMGATVSGSHILVDDYDLAVDLIEQLQNATDFPELFIELAAEYSSCGSAANGGDLGTWERGRMVPEFDEVIFDDLEIGEFTETPVETQFGYHVIYKTDASETSEFEDVRDDLEAGEIAQMQQIPGIFSDIMMTYRQEAGLTFTNPVLQARFEFLANGE